MMGRPIGYKSGHGFVITSVNFSTEESECYIRNEIRNVHSPTLHGQVSPKIKYFDPFEPFNIFLSLFQQTYTITMFIGQRSIKVYDNPITLSYPHGPMSSGVRNPSYKIQVTLVAK